MTSSVAHNKVAATKVVTRAQQRFFVVFLIYRKRLNTRENQQTALNNICGILQKGRRSEELSDKKIQRLLYSGFTSKIKNSVMISLVNQLVKLLSYMDVKNEKMGGNSWSMTLIKQPACKPYYVPEGKIQRGTLF